MLEESISSGGGGCKEASISPSLHPIYLFTGKRPTVAPYQQYVKPISFLFLFF